MKKYILTAASGVLSVASLVQKDLSTPLPAPPVGRHEISVGGGMTVNSMPGNWADIVDHQPRLGYASYIRYQHALKNRLHLGIGIEGVQLGFRTTIMFTDNMGNPLGTQKVSYLLADPALSFYAQLTRRHTRKSPFSYAWGARVGYTMGQATKVQAPDRVGLDKTSAGAMFGLVAEGRYALGRSFFVEASFAPRYYILKADIAGVLNNLSCFAYPLTLGVGVAL